MKQKSWQTQKADPILYCKAEKKATKPLDFVAPEGIPEPNVDVQGLLPGSERGGH